MGKSQIKRRSLRPSPDVTIACFANNTMPAPARSKKSTAAKELKKSTTAEDIKNEDNETDDWFTKDEEDICKEIEVLKIDSGCNTSSTSASSIPAKYYRHNHQQFPLDFWDLLSRYILPENVGSFGAICRCSYLIVNSQGFWRRLYRRYYNEDVAMNDRLRPDCMMRPRSLKICVIRVIHLCYGLYVEARKKDGVSLWGDPHLLVGGICDMSWADKVTSKHSNFYFKLREHDTEATKHKLIYRVEEESDDEGEELKHQQFLEQLEDINYNPDKGCRVLQVNSTCWASIPPVLGLRLFQVSLSVSHGMRFHKLKLRFGSPRTGGRGPPNQQDSVLVVIDNVVNLKVLNWWNPQYPQ